ncbi:MAG TPA: alpha/beta fold hydrolase [Sphingomonas sp.]|nr:alpha/beta fold hydrolase [Sphingomonas sp.]
MNIQPGLLVAADELFRSDDLLVRRVGGLASAICYVTFDSYTDNRTLDRPGFGEEYFRGRGIDAIHVLSRDNHWYQYPELPEALAVIAAVTQGYSKVIAYGSSMGGFAALRYGAACGATVGVALSPQFSVDPAVVPFDRRWADDVARIAFRKYDQPPLATQYIVYDPRDPYDGPHFQLFAERSPTCGVPVPHGGHPVGGYLVETDMLRRLLERVERGTFDHEAFARELRRRRRRSGHYFFVLAQRVPAFRRRQKVALAALAVETQSDNPLYHSQLAAALDAVGEHEAAYSVHLRAIEMADKSLHALHNLLLHHEACGEYGEALAIAKRLIAEHPEVLWLPKTAERLRRKRRHTTSLGRLASALFLDPLLDWLRV